VTVYVPDASRAVGVAASLLSAELRSGYVAEVASDYERSAQHAAKKGPVLASLETARANAFRFDWTHYAPPQPALPGRREIRNVDLRELSQFIDWGPLFQTWELSGPYPAILEDPVVGEAARGVYADAQEMLARIVEGRWLTASGVLALMPASSVGDDIELYADQSREKVALTWHNLRQQNEAAGGQAQLLPRRFRRAEGIATRRSRRRVRGDRGPRHRKKLSQFVVQKDDHSAIMLKALADRLAEAFAEGLHMKVRREFWGYASDERLDAAALIREEYRGIRPAPGYPACPDHTVKAPLFELLQAQRIGMSLTESYAMLPAASV
jgi:5-methyltetrahydrofolate--homocysteine methyltransferase